MSAAAKVFVNPQATLFLLGTEMDFEVTKLRTGFVFRNPNQTSACGCGESVEIKPARPGAPRRGARLSVDQDWLRDLFEPFGPVSIRRMFAGAGVYRDGVFFALATSDGGIYLKCDAEIEQRFRDAGSSPFIYGRDKRKITMSYWSLPNEALDDPDALKEWAELAYQAALRVPPRRRGRERAARTRLVDGGGSKAPRRREGACNLPLEGRSKAVGREADEDFGRG